MNADQPTALSGHRIRDLLDVVALDRALDPIICVIVDTEEEFDWSKPFDRNANSVSAIKEIGYIQDVFDRHGIKPVYACDYPIASKDESISILKEFVDNQRGVVGAHLHTWVNPPFSEPVNATNSYQGNLENGLEAEKLELLTNTLHRNFGYRPFIHKAGRYGLGPDTITALRQLDYKIDMSLMPGYDLSADGGPNFLEIDNLPGVFRSGEEIVEIPTTGSIIGLLSSQASRIEKSKGKFPEFTEYLSACLGKLRMLERMRLSPEGHSANDMIRLAKALLRRGQRILCLSLHSPTLKPGCTPYVSSKEDRADFINRTNTFLEFFFGEFGGRTLDFADIRELILASRP